MKSRAVININIYCLLLQYANSQYNPEVYSGIQQGYQYPYKNIAYSQYSNQRTYKNYDNNKWIQGNYEDYNDYVEEICVCDKCDETITKPACRNVCSNCFNTPPPIPSYVFLPFLYPYPMTPNTTAAPVPQTIDTTTASTVENTITTTEARTTEMKAIEIKTETVKTLTTETSTPPNALPEDNNDVLKDKSLFNIKDKGQYTLTSLRRTKPNWLPKYGMVPISDTFAEKLMLQLRSMRVLHPQKDNMRNTDEITPSY